MANTSNEDSLDAVARLVRKGREQGFVTADEVADTLSEALVDDAYEALARAGVRIVLEEGEAPSPVTRVRRATPGDGGDSDDTVGLYLREIGAIPLLTAEDEQRLAQTYEEGRIAEDRLRLAYSDAETLIASELTELKRRARLGQIAREEMIQANSRLVVHIAKRYVNYGLPFQDLIQEGNLGLIRAAERFDHRRGFRFSTYATYWIRQAITKALAEQARTIRVPAHMSDQISKLSTATRRLEQLLGRDPTLEELANELALSPRRVEQIIEASHRPLSLEMRVGDEADSELQDFIEDDDSKAPTEEAGRGLLREEIEQVLGILAPDEAGVLAMRYGLHGDKPHTLEEVADHMGVTRERVRQLETKAIRRLRHPTYSRRLRDYLR